MPPDHILERIARLADIDTRRAMGFPPRKLVRPDLKLQFECLEFVEFGQGVARYIKLPGARLYAGQDEITSSFGGRHYTFRRDGRVSHSAWVATAHHRHPDFNEDGTFRRAHRPL